MPTYIFTNILNFFFVTCQVNNFFSKFTRLKYRGLYTYLKILEMSY